MNRYEIRSIESGQITHAYTAESPMGAQPEWGTPEFTESVPVLADDGSPVLDEEGSPVTTQVAHPASYEVIVTPLTGKLDPRWIALRSKRGALLSACDWTQLLDAPLDDAAHAQWEKYRQALRDLPANTADPDNPLWPEAPT